MTAVRDTIVSSDLRPSTNCGSSFNGAWPSTARMARNDLPGCGGSSSMCAASRIFAVLAKMREAAHIDDDPPHPGKSFLAMRAVEGQAPLKDDPQFVEGRKSLETIVSRTAVIYADKLLGEASLL